RKCRIQRENVHFPDQQNDPAARNSARAGAKIDRHRQNRSSPEVHFEKRPPVFRASQIGEWKSRFRVRREKAEEAKSPQGGRGLNGQQFQALKIVDSTTCSVLFSILTLCVAPSAARVMTRSSIPDSLVIAPVSAVVSN